MNDIKQTRQNTLEKQNQSIVKYKEFKSTVIIKRIRLVN